MSSEAQPFYYPVEFDIIVRRRRRTRLRVHVPARAFSKSSVLSILFMLVVLIGRPHGPHPYIHAEDSLRMKGAAPTALSWHGLG